MFAGYLMAAIKKEKYEGVVHLAIIAKLFATVFLITYSVVTVWIWVVFLSGIFDLLMGVFIYFLYKQHKNNILLEAG